MCEKHILASKAIWTIKKYEKERNTGLVNDIFSSELILIGFFELIPNMDLFVL